VHLVKCLGKILSFTENRPVPGSRHKENINAPPASPFFTPSLRALAKTLDLARNFPDQYA
jgi:hypothetical protein